jgi:hypothetical protein
MAREIRKLTDADILSIIENELANANITAVTLEKLRVPLAYYVGLPNGTEVEGRSTLTSTDVADAIEWIMPQIMKSFTRNNEVVIFDPLNEADELQADIESQYVYDVLMKQNDGFVLIHQFVKDALLQRNGTAKVYYDDRTEIKVYTYTGLTEEQLSLLVSNENVEIKAMTPNSSLDQQGQPVVLYDVKIAVTNKDGQVVVVPVAPEEFRVNTQHNSISLEDARFTCHIINKSISDLREEGYSEEDLDHLVQSDLIRSQYRFAYQNEQTIIPSVTAADEANKLVEIGECYLKLDLNGDGITERVKITVGGVNNPTIILDKEEIDSSPWVATTAILMSHKFQGLSIYDRLKQIQDNKTATIRNIMDNMYLQNNQRNVVVEGQVNMDDLLVSRPGGIIRAKRLDAISPLATPQIGDAAFNMLRYLDEIKAGRTGVSADGTASPENIGDRVGSQGVDRMMNAKEELVGLIIRVICETGIKPLCSKIRDLVTMHVDTIQDFQYRGQWVKVNPAEWPKRSKSTVRVGTGTGDTRAKLAAIEKIQAVQAQIVATPGQALTNQSKIYATLDDFCKLSGLNGAGKYFINPNSQEGQQASQKATQDSQQQQQLLMTEKVKEYQLQAQLAQAATTTAEAQQANVQVKAQLELAKHQRDMDKHAFEAKIAQLLATIEQTKLVEKGHKEIADLKFKYDEMTTKNALELAKIDESRLQKEMDIAAKYQLAQLTATEAEPETEAEDKQEKGVEEPNAAIMGALADLKDTHMQTQAIIGAINKPKRIIRGADGRPEGIE